MGGRKMAAHRFFWQQENGKLPDGVQLDHLCRRRRCVRPAHLDPVSPRTNLKRTYARFRRAMEHCPREHLLAETGIDTPEGGRVCRICSGVPDARPEAPP